MDIDKQVEMIFKEVLKNSNIRFARDVMRKDLPDWDSLRNLTLLVRIEKKFGFRFEPGDVVDINSVGDLLDIVNQKNKENQKKS